MHWVGILQLCVFPVVVVDAKGTLSRAHLSTDVDASNPSYEDGWSACPYEPLPADNSASGVRMHGCEPDNGLACMVRERDDGKQEWRCLCSEGYQCKEGGDCVCRGIIGLSTPCLLDSCEIPPALDDEKIRNWIYLFISISILCCCYSCGRRHGVRVCKRVAYRNKIMQEIDEDDDGLDGNFRTSYLARRGLKPGDSILDLEDDHGDGGTDLGTDTDGHHNPNRTVGMGPAQPSLKELRRKTDVAQRKSTLATTLARMVAEAEENERERGQESLSNAAGRHSPQRIGTTDIALAVEDVVQGGGQASAPVQSMNRRLHGANKNKAHVHPQHVHDHAAGKQFQHEQYQHKMGAFEEDKEDVFESDQSFEVLSDTDEELPSPKPKPKPAREPFPEPAANTKETVKGPPMGVSSRLVRQASEKMQNLVKKSRMNSINARRFLRRHMSDDAQAKLILAHHEEEMRLHAINQKAEHAAQARALSRRQEKKKKRMEEKQAAEADAEAEAEAEREAEARAVREALERQRQQQQAKEEERKKAAAEAEARQKAKEAEDKEKAEARARARAALALAEEQEEEEARRRKEEKRKTQLERRLSMNESKKRQSKERLTSRMSLIPSIAEEGASPPLPTIGSKSKARPRVGPRPRRETPRDTIAVQELFRKMRGRDPSPQELQNLFEHVHGVTGTGTVRADADEGGREKDEEPVPRKKKKKKKKKKEKKKVVRRTKRLLSDSDSDNSGEEFPTAPDIDDDDDTEEEEEEEEEEDDDDSDCSEKAAMVRRSATRRSQKVKHTKGPGDNATMIRRTATMARKDKKVSLIKRQPTSRQSRKKIFCSNCGTPNVGGGYCTSCGEKLMMIKAKKSVIL